MRWIFLFGLLISLSGYSQCKSYFISQKGDTLNCVDMKGMKQGKWIVRYEQVRGEPGYEEEGEFKDDRKEGSWRLYSLDGDLIAIESYKWGNKNGVFQYFTKTGELIREESWRAVNPLSPYDTVEVSDWEKDPLGLLTKTVVVKLDGSAVKHGQWKYYSPQTGMVMKTETYVLGTLDTGPKKEIMPEDPENKKQVAKPKEVLDFEKKNSGKKKVRVRDGRTGG